MTGTQRIGSGLALAAALCLPGCYYSNRAHNIDTKPTVDTGIGAAIILPGQSAPAYTAEGVPIEGGSGSVARPRMSTLGGSAIDEQKNVEGKETPLLLKWVTAPLAVIAAPFAAAADAMKGEPAPGPPSRHLQPACKPVARSRRRLEESSSRSIARSRSNSFSSSAR